MNDEKLETTIGNVLLGGVLLAVAIVITGGTFYLMRRHAEMVNFAVFQGASSDLRTFAGIWNNAILFRSDAVIQLGLLVLIATPIARVALAAVGFYMERDHLYVTVSLTVLAILAYSILHAV